MRLKRYYWTGINTDGIKNTGYIQAANRHTVKLRLQEQHILILKIRKHYEINFKFSFKSKKLRAYELALFYRQLSTLIKSGTPLLNSLDVLLKNAEQRNLAPIIQSLKSELAAGNSLSQSLQKFSDVFDFVTSHLVYIAEQTGTLDTTLTRIASHQENVLHLKNKIKQILIYPTILLIVSLIVSMILLIFVVPRFEALFADFNATLPAFTLLIIHFSHFITHYCGAILISALIICLGFWWCCHKFPTLRILIDQLLFKIPLLGKFIKKYLLARFSRTLAALFHTGIPITEGLKMLTDLNKNAIMKQAIHHLVTAITHGQRLYIGMQNQLFFPPMMIQMVQVGEESGSLDAMLDKIADFYEADLDHWIKNFSNLLEPLIITILGVLIGGLIIAMYLPIFKLGTVI